MYVCLHIYVPTQPYVYKLVLFLHHPLLSILDSLDRKIAESDAVPVVMRLVLKGK